MAAGRAAQRVFAADAAVAASEARHDLHPGIAQVDCDTARRRLQGHGQRRIADRLALAHQRRAGFGRRQQVVADQRADRQGEDGGEGGGAAEALAEPGAQARAEAG
ncbi:hypothetical protein RZS08_26775, partial [Arthrospira platensis SPKY1]|nr:hypothetical protein [Arthrospira platensis SPKY1]